MCTRNIKKFLCCMPLWVGLLVTGALASGQAVVALLLIESTGLIFVCLLIVVMMLLTLAFKKSHCFRKALFIGHVLLTTVELPLFCGCFATNPKLFALLVTEKCEPSLVQEQSTGEVCQLKVVTDNVIVAAATLAAYIVIKVYLSCVLFAFSNNVERIDPSASPVVEGKIAEMPVGVELEIDESVCDKLGIAVPCEADDEEKDT